ncbi:DUF1775 domain-containing protein [Actinoallomurus sp. NPDC052274]|uniref:DUF1775 domain-containing protein n=1 Tax=Actinoallomurus sp. NPDC052274 TaxID=3155420 RepID=UPI003421512F
MSAGPLPKADSMTFKTLQYYGDDQVVRWIQEPQQPNGPEPENPAPMLRLLPPSKTGAGPAADAPARASRGGVVSEADDTVAYWALGLSVVAALAALGSAVMALRASRR